MTGFWTFVGVAASMAAALPWDGASRTDPVVAIEGLGWAPIATQPPLLPYDGATAPMPGKHLLARAFTDRLCGYVNGISERAWTCDYSLATCTFSRGMLGCCYPDSTGSVCGFESTCIGAAQQSSCGDWCLSDQYIRKCTNSNEPFCILYTGADNDVSVWGCKWTSGLTESFLVNTAIPMATEDSVTSTPSPVSSTTPFDSELPRPTVTGETNVGAIAGGVVGGLAVVVLGGLGLFLVRSLRKKNAAATAAQGQTVYQLGAPPAQPMIQPPMVQPIHSSGYPDQNWNNQVYASAAPQQQSHHTKYSDSEVTSPANGPPQYGAPSQKQGYQAQQPQQSQQVTAPPLAELSDGQ